MSEWIAGRYASGEPETSLAALHRADPERIPAPLIIRRWRQTWPAFDALMIEAAQCRAEALFEECLPIADDHERVAASARVATDVRYGKRVELSARLSWDQVVAQSLEAVRVDAIEHDSGEEVGRAKDSDGVCTIDPAQISAVPEKIPVHIPESSAAPEKNFLAPVRFPGDVGELAAASERVPWEGE